MQLLHASFQENLRGNKCKKHTLLIFLIKLTCSLLTELVILSVPADNFPFSDLYVSVNVTSVESNNIIFFPTLLGQYTLHPQAFVKFALTLTLVYMLQVTKLPSQNMYREELHISYALLFTITALTISCGVYRLWKLQ